MDENINKIPEVTETNYNYVLISVLILVILFATYFFVSNNNKLSSIIPFGEEFRINKLRHDVSEKIATGDIKNCEKIEDAQFRNICLDNINMTKAREVGDLSLCANSTGSVIEEDTCVLQNLISSALQNKDVSICDKGIKETLINECQKTYFAESAVINGNVNVCSGAVSATQKQYCTDYFSNTNQK